MRFISFLKFSCAVLALVLSFTLVSAAVTGGAQSRPLITSAINENNTVTLHGNTIAYANAQTDRGRVSDTLSLEHLQLILRRPAEQEQALGKYIDDLQKPNSPNYHQWLTAQQFGQRYGLNKSDLDTISGWLQGHGFKVNVMYTNGVVIDFSGTAGMIRQTFQTEIHNLVVNGQKHISNMSDPKVPAALSPAVIGIASLNDFKPHTNYKKKAEYTVSVSDSTYLLVPADLATIYNLNPLFDDGISGQGQTVAVLEDTDIHPVDWHAFRATLGLGKYAQGTFTTVHPNAAGGLNCNDPGTNGDSGEASLDAEWASAAAPNAAIVMASCASTTTFGGLIAMQNMVNNPNPPEIVSSSYGLCEALTADSLKAAFNSAFQQAVSEGVSVFAAAGDAAAAECDRPYPVDFHGIGVLGWTDTPYNVSVGGTDFGDLYAAIEGGAPQSTYWSPTNSSTFGSALSYIPEIPWNDSCASQLIATVEGFATTYGSDGFCNSSAGSGFLNTVGGGGGPSECATGTPSIYKTVSGTCEGYAKPSWQSVFGNPNDGVRDTPDVSLFAANGVWGHYYVFCDSIGGFPCTGAPDTWDGAGGTSFASPILAGMQALVNQKNGAYQGNPNVAYYALANAEYGSSGSSECNSTLGNGVASSCVFYDVTLGDMDVPCSNEIGDINCYIPSGKFGVLSTSNSSYQPAYGAANGWDFATGIGTVNVTNLVNQWSTVAPKARGDK